MPPRRVWRTAVTAQQHTSTDDIAPALSDEHRAKFRAAGFWMAIVGWIEIACGVAAAVVWLLGLLEDLPSVELWKGRLDAILAIGSLIIGGLTLTAARSFRRAGRD